MGAGSSNQGSDGWASWIAFAGLMMMLLGVFDIIGGLGALFSDDVYFREAGGNLWLLDFTAYGIGLMAFGVLLIAAGWGVINGSGMARAFAIVVVFLNAAAHLAYFHAAPFWSFLVIIIDIFILFALTVRWERAQKAL